MPHDVPFVLVEKQGGAMRISAQNRHAADLGLAPGLPLADAQGYVSELRTLAHDAQADSALLKQLVRACNRYTPSVMADPPQGLMLDITGTAHLHGGETALRRALVKHMKGQGLTARVAIADTPDAARALACFGGDDVHALPLAALNTGEDTRQALHRAGFRVIGDLALLPPAPLAARFGPTLVRTLNRLLSREDPHIIPDISPDPVTAEMRFAEPVGRTDDVLDTIEMLVERAAVKLAERGEGGRTFVIRLHRSDGHIAPLAIETGAPTRDPALVLRLLRERIDSLADPLDPGFGYDSIDLAVPHAEALDEQQEALDTNRAQTGNIGPLLDSLAVRYGPDRVLRFGAGNTHIPERAGVLHPVSANLPGASWPEPEAQEPPLRPLILFDPPQRIDVLAAVPDGPPKRFRWLDKSWHVIAQEGPERLAPEWWNRREGHADNPGRSRDYYRVEEEGGHRFWLFRHGLYEREVANPSWYVHGLFA